MFVFYILDWGTMGFCIHLKGAVIEKSLRNARLDLPNMDKYINNNLAEVQTFPYSIQKTRSTVLDGARV